MSCQGEGQEQKKACEGKHSRRFEKAEDRAASKGEQWPTVDDASEIQKTTATFVDVLLGDTDVFNCTQDTDDRVDCLVNVAADTPSFDLSTDLLSAAQEVNSSISEDTTLWIQAWGGGGGNGATAKAEKREREARAAMRKRLRPSVTSAMER